MEYWGRKHSQRRENQYRETLEHKGAWDHETLHNSTLWDDIPKAKAGSCHSTQFCNHFSPWEFSHSWQQVPYTFLWWKLQSFWGKKCIFLICTKFVHIPRQGWAPGNTNPLIMYIDYGAWYLQPEWFALKRSHAPRDIQVFPFEYIITNPILVLFQTWLILLRLC